MKTEGDIEQNLLIGFDTRGEVFVYEDRIFRGIYKGNGSLYRNILDICIKNDLFRCGIVPTRLAEKDPFPARNYDLVLEHERVPFITYPHEWPTEMLKDAAIFHLGLSQKLADHSMIIKDFHPWNILFDGARPVFVDFPAIIFPNNLLEEDWLEPVGFKVGAFWRSLWDTYTKYFYQLYIRMFIPYFLTPLKGYEAGLYKSTRHYIFTNTMNAEKVSGTSVEPGMSFYRRLLDDLESLSLKWALRDYGKTKSKFIRHLEKQIEALNVSSGTSGYLEYYKQKGEDFPFEPCLAWEEKQKAVYESIIGLKPETVLDVGSNTGWFSILAAKMGCRVVALDNDESSVNSLYQTARNENLNILPLVMDFLKLTPDIFPVNNPDTREMSDIETLYDGKRPLLISAKERLKCDMVIALAIVHHLALGHNLNFGEICEKFSVLSKKYLILEYVGKEDKLIVDEPTFFPAYNKNPAGFEWYNVDNLLKELEKHFKKISIRSSHPDSRKFLVCEKS